MDDWRRMGQERYLRCQELEYVPQYTPPGPAWDHEHCAFCFATISGYGGDLNSGYRTVKLESSRWICPACFADFSAEFQWTVKAVGTGRE